MKIATVKSIFSWMCATGGGLWGEECSSSNAEQNENLLPHRFMLRVAVRAKPLDRIKKGLFRRSLREAEFGYGFGRIEEHLVFGHANSTYRRFRWFARKFRQGFAKVCGGECYSVGHFHFRRGNTSEFLKDGEGFLQRPVAFGVTEDVALPHPALFSGENVSDADVADVHPVESCVDVTGHLAIEVVDNDFAGRRRFYVARTNWSGGVHNDNG